MQQLRIFRVAILLTLTSTIYGQGDLQLCPGGLITTVDPKWVPIPPRFEAVTEMISENQLLEISQAFSLQRDSIMMSSREGPFSFYYDFITNEQFQVANLVLGSNALPQCARQVIQPDSETSVIQPRSYLVKPSALLGYDARNQPNPHWGVQYIGSEDLRGFPTNKFKACFYLDDIKSTVSAVYYAADPLKFQFGRRQNQSIILRMEVKLRSDSGRQESYDYNVFSFRTNIGRREERRALDIPEGVYCPNRTSTVNIPENIPDRLSANSELFSPAAGGSILSTHGLYDDEFQLTRFDIWMADPYGSSRWDHYSEIHDFAVGLKYQYNYTTSECNVNELQAGIGSDAETVEGNQNVLQLASVQHLWLLDDATFQYSGEKRCHHHIWCHVWIAEKVLPNKTIQYREWYWASRINDEPLREFIPMKLAVRAYTNNTVIYSVEIQLFNYRRRPMTIFEVDYSLAACYRALGPSNGYNVAVLSFDIDNSKNYAVLNNINYLRLQIFERLAITLRVRPTRISNLNVDKNSNNITVTFTLLDAPPRTGPVEFPLKEESLDKLVERLESAIDANSFTFRAKLGSTTVRLRAHPRSLNVPHRSTIVKTVSSGKTITGLWIGLIIVGILIGAIGGFIALGHFAK